MEYVSSDTSVWIDFSIIGCTELPFRLPYTYIMNNDAIEDELMSPSGLGEELKKNGLVSVELTFEEFTLAEAFGQRYPRLSIYDRIALSIAKERRIVLLTGDGALRKSASNEGVSVLGTLGILDQLFDGHYISKDEYEECLHELERNNGNKVRLPKSEITTRLQGLMK